MRASPINSKRFGTAGRKCYRKKKPEVSVYPPFGSKLYFLRMISMYWVTVLFVLLVITCFFAYHNYHSNIQEEITFANKGSVVQFAFHDDVIQKSLDAHETKNAFSGFAKVSQAIGSLRTLSMMTGGVSNLQKITGQDIISVQEILQRQYSHFVSSIRDSGHNVQTEETKT